MESEPNKLQLFVLTRFLKREPVSISLETL
jgi:hypothetical protein